MVYACTKMRYFVVVGGADEGPFTFDQLKDLAAKGELTPESMLRPEEGGDSVAASTLGGLFAAPPPPPPGYSAPPSVPTTSPGRNPVLIAVIVCAALCVVCLPIAGAILFPVFSQARLAAEKRITVSRLKQIGTAALIYATDNDDHLPPVMTSALDAGPYIGKFVALTTEGETLEQALTSKNARSNTLRGNETLAGQDPFELQQPQLTLMFFDSMDWPGGKRCVGMADGSAKTIEGTAVVEAVAQTKGVVSPLALQTTKN